MSADEPLKPAGRGGQPWWWMALAGLLVTLAVVVAVLAAAGTWIWHSSAAQSRLLQAVPGLSVEGLKGRLTGGPLALETLRWQDSAVRVEVDGLQWQDLSWQWRPHAGAWLGLTLNQPQARAIRVVRQPADPTAPALASQAPDSLRLPLALSLQGLEVRSVQLDGQDLLTALGADVTLSAQAGAQHRVDKLRLTRDDLQVTGQLAMGTDGELPLTANLALATSAGGPLAWHATLQASGPLRRLALDARLQTAAGASLAATAAVTAFSDWPLAALALQTQDLNLSTLSAGLPETSISGRAEWGEVTAGQPLSLRLALNNTKPGPWDAGRLPVRSAHGTLQGRPSEPERLVFDGWQVGLGRSEADGQVLLSGVWQAAQLDLQARLQGVQAAPLHTAAPAAAMDGTLTLSLKGLAIPGSKSGGTTVTTTRNTQTSQPVSGTATLALTGRLNQPREARLLPVPMALSSDLAFALAGDGSLSLSLSKLQARAGASQVLAALDARRDKTGAWQLKTDGKLDRLDLAAWWPAAGASKLNGQWTADLQLPKLPAADLLMAMRGQVQVSLQRSQWSGLVLSGAASLGAQAQGLVVDAQLDVAGNRLTLNGTTPVDLQAAGSRQDWRADLQAPALAALAPLLARVPGAAGWIPEAGAVRASAVASGRWPVLRSQGQLQAEGLKTPQGRMGKAALSWTFNGLTLDAPLKLDADLSDLAQAERRIDRLQVHLDGSLREHQIRLSVDSPLRPPAWTDVTLAASAPAAKLAAPTAAQPAPSDAVAAAASAPSASASASIGSSLQLQAQGRWQPASTATAATLGAGVWRVRVATLRAGSRTAAAVPWLAAQDLDASVTLDAALRPIQAQLSPGVIQAFGGGLSWQQAQWLPPERPGAAPRWTLDAQLQPLKVAPILAGLQPDTGWRGDLVIGGTARVRSGARFDADITLERQSGDLGLTLAGSRRNLELSTLRLALAAHDGQWVVSQAMVGGQVGVFGGSQTLQLPVDTLMPPDSTALQGGFSLKVADASVWASWLPPGWRLGGEVAASVALGGQLGAPTVKGELLGDKLLVRNIVEGINLKDGSLRVKLDSQQALIEKLQFQGVGGGGMTVQGRVNYDGKPQADLKLTLDKFRALDRVDRRVALSGQADLGLRDGRVSVKGSFGIDEGLIDVTAADAPSLSSDVTVVGRTDAQGRPVAVAEGGKAAPEGALAGANIDLRLALGDALRLRGKGLDSLLKGQLRISTNAAGQVLVRGVVNTEQGTYTAYGQNLVIRRGTISFSGDVANPRLDILALRADLDMPVGVIVSGLAVDPRVRFYSEPDMPEVDQLTWLLTGQAPQGQGRDESALLQRAAMALLAGDQGATNDGVLQKLGIDQFGVGRSDGGDTVVTIGKQLSQRLSVVYEKGLAAAGGTWSLLYRVAGRTTLRAQTGVENAVEVIWSWRWD